ncbi:hypothetical protein LL912_23985 [Niabella sp. CC-SYL272]|uniref:hypothetical protein n=1 Tax=Niabella agricola TaxID=2891571 RepID=UPI001F25E028|nr:hypothetical protein [Niabella agricola]MCF3111870.1 hypothetical protein [Niabella agricola]
MKQAGVFLLWMLVINATNAQQIESIHFHLYTDSLKKGTYNYINVDGKMSDGSWQPLTDKELRFTTDYGKFEGNSLVLPEAPAAQKVSITAALKSNPKMTRNIVIWIKQKPDPPLPKYEAEVPRRARRR